MGIFDVFRKKQAPAPEEDQSIEDFMSEYRAKRMEEERPILFRGAVGDPLPPEFTHFDLNNVVIGRIHNEYDRYLFDGENAAMLIRDIHAVNEYALKAAELVPGIPSFYIDPVEVAVDPFPIPKQQRWQFSRIIVDAFTETGRIKKYPVRVLVETLTGEKTAHFYYLPIGLVGKGSITIHLKPNTAEHTSYSMDFINGVVSHVWENTAAGKTALYNKNNG